MRKALILLAACVALSACDRPIGDALGSLSPGRLLGSIGSAGPGRVAAPQGEFSDPIVQGTARAPVAIRPVRPLVEPGSGTSVVDARPLVAQVTAARIEPAARGAIVTATGLAPVSGAFNAQLTREGFENGTLVLAFRAEVAADATGGPEAARRLTAATALDAEELPAIRAVRVIGQANAITASR